MKELNATEIYIPQGYVGKISTSYNWMLFKRGKLRHLAVNITRCLFVYLRKSDLKLLFSCSVVFYSLWPDVLRYSRFPCSSLCPRTCLNSWPQSQWCHPTTSSSLKKKPEYHIYFILLIYPLYIFLPFYTDIKGLPRWLRW